MTAKPLVSALVGTGSIARQLHLPAHSRLRHSELKWVCDANLETARAFAEEHRIPHYTDVLDELLADTEVNWVDIATPNATHEPIAVRCMAAGKHALVQKPMASSADAAARMIEAAGRYGRQLGVYMFFRSDTGLELLRSLIAAGCFGGVISLRGKMISDTGFRLADGSWRKQEGCGALEQLGIHLIDLFLWLYGRIEWVSAYSHTLYAVMPGDDVTTAIYGLAGGVTALLETTYCSFSDSRMKRFVLEVNGTAGWASYDLIRAELTLQLKSDCHHGDFCYHREEGIAVRSFDSAYKGGIHRVHQAFVDAIREERPFFIGGGAGEHALQAVEATFRSAREGRRINL